MVYMGEWPTGRSVGQKFNWLQRYIRTKVVRLSTRVSTEVQVKRIKIIENIYMTLPLTLPYSVATQMMSLSCSAFFANCQNVSGPHTRAYEGTSSW